MWEIAERFRVKIGNITYINCDMLVAYKGQSLFTLKRTDDGYLGIYFDIYNAEHHKIASVKRNEIYYDGKDKDRFRLDGTANRITLTDTKTDQVICDIRKREDSDPAELEVSVLLYTPGGLLFNATPTSTNLGSGGVIGSATLAGCKVGISIE